MNDRDLTRLLGTPGARALAFDPLGGSIVAFPPELATSGLHLLSGATPLEELEPDSHSDAVIAYERARRRGRGAASVRRLGDDDPSWLEIFNLADSHGCLVAVLVPDSGEVGDERSPATELAPRQAHYLLNAAGVIVGIGPEMPRLLGWTEEQMVGKSSLEFIHPDDHETGIVAWVELLQDPGGEKTMRQRFRAAGGEWRWCEVTDINLLDDPSAGHVRGNLVDITRELAVLAELQRRETLLDRLSRALPTGLLHLDDDGRPRYWNERWESLTGLAGADGVEGLLGVVADPARLELALGRAVDHETDADLDLTLTGRGSCRFAELHLRPLVEDGVPIGLLLTLDDVTAARTHQEELAAQARRDPLTGAFNRLGIEELIGVELADDHPHLALLYLDLDHFKRVNDEHGHAVGDDVLRGFVDAMRSQLRQGELIGRVGGDEFLVVLPGEHTPEGAAVVADRLIAAAAGVPAALGREHDVTVSVSVGVAVAQPGDDFDSLLQQADVAMYDVKRRSLPLLRDASRSSEAS